MTSERPAVRRGAALGVVAVVLLAGYQLARRAVPGELHPWLNAAAGVVALGVALACGLRRDDLGLERAQAARGAAYGAVVWLAVAAGMTVVALVPATRDLFDDRRADVDTAAMLREVLLVIPLSTVVLEEIVFRGILLGGAARITTWGRAAWVSAVAFGLWHIAPTLSSSGSNATTRGAGDTATALLVVGVVVAMTAAGLFLAWLRIRSRSLVAPVLAHWGVNASAFLVAWVVGRS